MKFDVYACTKEINKQISLSTQHLLKSKQENESNINLHKKTKIRGNPQIIKQRKIQHKTIKKGKKSKRTPKRKRKGGDVK